MKRSIKITRIALLGGSRWKLVARAKIHKKLLGKNGQSNHEGDS